MSDRLDALLRQRALLQEHLAWLDSEIAAARPGLAAAPVAAPAPVVSLPLRPAPLAPAPVLAPAAPESAPVAPSVLAAQADEILESYRTPPTSLKSDVRKGCLLYFVAALALVALGVTALYFLIGTRR